VSNDKKHAPLSAVALSTAFWSYLALSSPPLFAGALLTRAVTAPFDRERKWLHLYTSAWAYHYVKLLPLWKTRFSGVHHIQDGKPYVLVANHQSLGDILVLFGLFKQYKWVSKRSIFKVPFIGWNMYLNDYVGLERGDKQSIGKMLDECREHLREGSSVMLFPEGTRSVDGELKPFKHGAFTLAKEFGVPVVPIVIDGTRDALPKHGLVFPQTSPLTIRVHVMEPVSPDAAEDARALSELVRGKMVLELAAMRRSEGGTGPRSAASDSPLPAD
jgi:1-acyl-sn-glycerol-3-phosphate acyltransferase